MPPGSRVLDIGGATGLHALPVATDGHDVPLLDPYADAVGA